MFSQRWSFSKLSVAETSSSPSPASAYTWLKRGKAGPAMVLCLLSAFYAAVLVMFV